MKLGYASAILPEQSLEYVIDFAADNGYQCVEMMCWPKGKAERRYAGVTHIDIDALNKDEAKRINDYISDKGVSISALGYYPNPLDADLEKRAVYVNHIIKLIDGAALLGVDTVTTFIGRDPKTSVSDNMAEFRKVWPDIIKRAEDKGIRIAIENCPMYFTMDEWPGGKNIATTPKIWREMFEAIPSANFGLNFDPSHFVWQMMDYIAPIYEFNEKLFHIHIKDIKLHPNRLNQVGTLAPPLEFQTPKLPGLGDVDWAKFVSALTDVRYNGAMVVEVEDKAFEDTLEGRLKALRQSKKYVDQFIS